MKYSYFKFEVYTSTTVFNPTEIHLYESGVEFFPSSISGVSYSARSVGTYGPQLAFDGNSSTSYMSAAELNPHWIAVNLNGTTKNLTEFRLENRTDTHLPYILNVYVSLDGISWNLYGGINFENWVASSSTLTRHITTFKDTLSNVLFLQLSGNPGDTLFRSSDYNYRLIANAGGGTYISTSNPPTNYTNSTYFNGVVNNYLIVNKTTDLKWWLSSPINFTIEAFVYPTDLNTWGNTIIPFFISQGNGIVSTPDWAFGPLSNGKIAFYYNNGSSVYVYSTATISINQWSHIAVSITATTIYILVNGVIYSTAKLATTIADAYSLIIIGQGVNTEIKGYVSSIRISNTAFYTTNTTVPIAPFYYNTALTPLVLSSDTSYKKQIAVPTDGIPPIKVLSNDNNIINQIQTPLLTPRIQLINNSPVSPFIGINFYIIDTVLGTKSSILAIPYFNYTFTIKGTVTINGVPASRKVRLYYQNDNSIVAENVSDATTGYYEFDNLNIEDYYISARHMFDQS